MIKNYQKFKSYKTVFAIFLVTVLISSVMGFIICRRDAQIADAVILLGEVLCDLRFAVIFEVIFLLWLFTAGPTIYAPVGSFAAIAVYGALFGARTANLTESSMYLITVEVFFSTLTAYLLVIYSSFVTLTGLRIFTDTKTDNKRELFDGVLFRAEGFKEMFNMRFVASYIALFLIFSALLGLSSAVKVFLLSL